MLTNLSTIPTYGVGSDNYTKTFTSNELDLLNEELERREANTKIIKGESLNFLTRENIEEQNLTLDSLYAHENKAFAVISNDLSKSYPIGEGSWLSLKNRIELYGEGLLKLEDELLRDVLNSRTFGKTYQAIVIDDKIRGVFSDSTRGYKYISQKEILEITYDAANHRFGQVNFKYGEMTYDYSKFKFLIEESVQELTDLYGKEQTLIPGILLRSSDTGYQSTEIIPIWQVGSNICPEDYEGLKLVHRGFGEDDYDRIRDAMPNLFLRMRNTIELVTKQMQTEIKDPIKTLNSCCKYLSIPKKYVQELKEQLYLQLDINTNFSGYDITKLVIDHASLKEEKEKERFEVYGGKFLNIDYDKHQ